ncbi:unnamed protein product, partial [Ectocarpus sp. 6 AP-2014]
DRLARWPGPSGFLIARRLSLCPPLHTFICGSPLTRGTRSDPLSLPCLSVWIYLR